MKLKLGNRAAFALELEWQPCERLADDGQRRTWATLSIFCQGKPLTLHVVNGETHDDLVGPASSLASWIGRNWAALERIDDLPGATDAIGAHEFLGTLGDEEWDEREEELDRWISRHSLLRVGRGTILPNVILWNRGEFFDVSWRADPEPEPGRRIQFLATGEARLSPQAVLPVLQQFVRAVAERIEQADELSAVRAEVLEVARVVLGWEPRAAQSAAGFACSEDSKATRYSPMPKGRK